MKQHNLFNCFRTVRLCWFIPVQCQLQFQPQNHVTAIYHYVQWFWPTDLEAKEIKKADVARTIKLDDVCWPRISVCVTWKSANLSYQRILSSKGVADPAMGIPVDRPPPNDQNLGLVIAARLRHGGKLNLELLVAFLYKNVQKTVSSPTRGSAPPPPDSRLGSRSTHSPWSPPLANPGSATAKENLSYFHRENGPIFSR